MLVLTRKFQESVVIAYANSSQPILTVTVVEIAGGTVRLGFQAEPAVLIHRLEIWQKIDSKRPPAALPPTTGPPDPER